MIGEYPTLYYRENWLTEETGIFDTGCYSIKCNGIVGKRKRRKIDIDQDSRIVRFNDTVTIHPLSITLIRKFEHATKFVLMCHRGSLDAYTFRQSIDSRVYLHPRETIKLSID